MITTILFWLGTYRSFRDIKRVNNQTDKLAIVLLSYTPYLVLSFFSWIVVNIAIMMFHTNEILGKRLEDPVNYFGTLGEAYNYLVFIKILWMILIAVYLVMYSYKKIEDIIEEEEYMEEITKSEDLHHEMRT